MSIRQPISGVRAPEAGWGDRSCAFPASHSQSGMVLMLVVFIVAVLGILVLQYSYLIRLDTKMAQNFRESSEAYSLAKAGVNQAIALLEDDKISDQESEEEGEEEAKQETGAKKEGGEQTGEDQKGGRDDLQEDWAQPQEAVKMGSGQFVFKIVDEDRKFNVNLLAEGAVEEVEKAREKKKTEDTEGEEKKEGEEAQKGKEKTAQEEEKSKEEKKEGEEGEEEEEEEETKIDKEIEEKLIVLLEKLGVKTPKDVVKSIIDWIDKDDQGESEDQSYTAQETGYPCRNGPLETNGEIALIKEIGREVFEGGSRQEKIEVVSEESPPASYGEEEVFPGLIQFLTVYSDGKVNVNTAPLPVIQTLLGEDEEDLAEDIIRAREEEPFSDLDEVEKAIEKDIPDKSLQKFKVNSKYFTILAEGQSGSARARIRVVVQRLDEEIRILYWRFES